MPLWNFKHIINIRIIRVVKLEGYKNIQVIFIGGKFMTATIDWTIIFQWVNLFLVLLIAAIPVLIVVLLVLKIRNELRKK